MNPLPAIERSRRTVFIAAIGGLVFTVLWLALCFWYVAQFFGLENLQFQQPHELAATIGGIAAPLLLVWVIILVFVRANVVSAESRELLRHLEAMTYPTEEADWKVARITNSLKEQAELLSKATDEMVERMEEMRGAFRLQSQELTGASVRAAS